MTESGKVQNSEEKLRDGYWEENKPERSAKMSSIINCIHQKDFVFSLSQRQHITDYALQATTQIKR